MPSLSRRAMLAGICATMSAGTGIGAAAERKKRAAAVPDDADPLSAADIEAVFTRATEALKAQTAAHVASWHMDGARWAVDLDIGQITFVNQRGWTIRAPVQVIGTRALADGTWLWSWDHPSIPKTLAADARRVRAFGRRQGLEALITRKIVAAEQDAWRFTALAAYLAGANGAYRGPTGPNHVFMTFGEIVISKA